MTRPDSIWTSWNTTAQILINLLMQEVQKCPLIFSPGSSKIYLVSEPNFISKRDKSIDDTVSVQSIKESDTKRSSKNACGRVNFTTFTYRIVQCGKKSQNGPSLEITPRFTRTVLKNSNVLHVVQDKSRVPYIKWTNKWPFIKKNNMTPALN